MILSSSLHATENERPVVGLTRLGLSWLSSIINLDVCKVHVNRERTGLKIHYFNPGLNFYYARPKELSGEVGIFFLFNFSNENCVFIYYQDTLL